MLHKLLGYIVCDPKEGPNDPGYKCYLVFTAINGSREIDGFYPSPLVDNCGFIIIYNFAEEGLNLNRLTDDPKYRRAPRGTRLDVDRQSVFQDGLGRVFIADKNQPNKNKTFIDEI